MADDVLQFDKGSILAAERKLTAGVQRGATTAVAETTKWLERRLEDVTKAAVPGRLYKAWRSKGPRAGRAVDRPFGTIYVEGERSLGAIQFFTRPGRLTAKDGGPVAVPLPAAGARGRDRMLTPAEWERRTGQKLRFVPRRGRPPLLVADAGRVTRSGRYGKIGGKGAGDGGYRKGQATVAIFVILTDVPFKNSVAINPIVGSAREQLSREFVRQVGKLG